MPRRRELQVICQVLFPLTRLANLEDQRGNLVATRHYADETLDWSRRLGMAQEQAQVEALYARLAQVPKTKNDE